MAVTERTRHELHEALVELMGRTHTATLVEHLPPTGWGDVATKADLDHLEQRIQLRMEALEHCLAGAIAEKNRQTVVAAVAMMFSQTTILATLILATR